MNDEGSFFMPANQKVQTDGGTIAEDLHLFTVIMGFTR
jgi:hypothetical protein